MRNLKIFFLIASFFSGMVFTFSVKADKRQEVKKKRRFSLGGLGLKKRLVAAVNKQELSLVLDLLRSGAKQNLDLRDPKGETLLHMAARLDSLEIVQALLENKAFLDAQDNLGLTPLHYALHSNKKNAEKIAFYLIEKGADLWRKVGKDHNLPIHMAVSAGFERVVDLILKKDPSFVDKKNRGERDYLQETPLFIASVEMNYEVSKILIAAGADVHYRTRNGKTALDPQGFSSLRRRDFQAFMKEREKVRQESIARLLKAVVEKPDLSEVLIALNDGARLNGVYYRKGKRVFYSFTTSKMIPYAEGSKENMGNTIFHLAIESANKDFIKFFMNPFAPSEEAGKKERFFLSASNHLNDHDINMKNEKGQTPLQVALLKKSTEIADILVTRIPDIKVPPKNKKIHQIHLALKNNRMDVVEYLLLKSKNKINSLKCTDERGYNSIHIAAEYGRVKALRLFKPYYSLYESEYYTRKGYYYLHFRDQTPHKRISKSKPKKHEGADTALHLAARNDHLACVKFILRKGGGADTFAHNASGLTPWGEFKKRDKASLNKNQLEIRELLKKTRRYK